MGLQRKIDKEAFDKLSDATKEFYHKVGENYILDLDGEDENVTAHKNETAAEKAKRIALEQELAKLRGEKTAADEAAMKAAGDIAGLETAWTAKLTSAVETEKQNTARYVGMVESMMIGNMAEEMGMKLSSKAGKLLAPLIRARLGVDMTGDEPAIVIKGADGKPSTMTREQLHEEFFNNKDYSGIIDGSKASGGQTANKPSQPASQGNNVTDLSKMSAASLVAHLDGQ